MMRFSEEAEGEGFEPSSDLTARNGFRDRRIRPLCHPSAEPCGQTAGYPLVLEAAMRERLAAGAGLGPAGGEAGVEKAQQRRRGQYGGNMVSPVRVVPRRSCRERRGGEGGIRTLEAGIYST